MKLLTRAMGEGRYPILGGTLNSEHTKLIVHNDILYKGRSSPPQGEALARGEHSAQK